MQRQKLILGFSTRYLMSPKRKKLPSLMTTISFIGIALSVATLIVVMSVMNGFVDELTSKILGFNSHVTLVNFGMEKIPEYEQKVKEITRMNDVKYVNPIVEGQGMLINTKTGTSSGVMVRGMFSKDLEARQEVAKAMVLHPSCENDIFMNNQGIVIGAALARNIGVGIGQDVSLVTSVGDKTIFGFMPRYKNFFICGIFESGATMYDSSTVFASFKIAQVLFKYKDSASGVEIFLNNHLKTEDFSAKLINDNIWNGYIQDWKRGNQELFHAMKIERSVMSFILSLFIIVSMFGIFANMSSLVSAKTRNIAIMKSMGFSDLDIKQIFAISGMIIGISGIIFGVVLGISFALNIQTIKACLETMTGVSLFDGAVYFLSYLPAKLFLGDIVWIILLSLSCAILSSIIPAVRAAKTNCAETLRQI